MTPRERKRAIAGVFIVIALLFCGGILVGYAQRNDKICRDGKAPKRERPDVLLGHTIYQCHSGQIVTR